MKNLTKNKVISYLEKPEDIILKQQARIEFLESWLNDVLVRDDDKRIEDVKKVINRLETVKVNILPYIVLDDYGHKYFTEECDTKFKIELAKSILDFVRIYYPNYTNELLEGIANNTSEYTANYIFMEKL